MATDKDADSPATTSLAYDSMVESWDLIDTLLGGTVAMRAAGERYAPKHTEETDAGYDNRLASSVLYNLTEKTLDTLAGKPFSEDVKLNDDVPAAIADQILPDVDLQGNNLTVFARQWFREGFAKAFAHVLVDMPRRQDSPDRRRTLADDRREGARPYWVLVKPENLLFASAEIIDGKEVLTHVRIYECTTMRQGFAEVEQRRIRVLEPGRVQMYRPEESKKGGKSEEEWVLDDEWETGLSYIPLVTFYAHRSGLMKGKPPLEDLAHLNVAHWQSTADQRHILTVARFPILACSGSSGEESDPIVVGPNRVLYNEDPKGKFYYVEHTGASIEAGRKDLEDLERYMANYGAEFLKEKPGEETATGRVLDSAEATSELAAITGGFEDAVAQALDITADWMRIAEGGGTVELNKEYDVEEIDESALTALRAVREGRDMSRLAYLSALKLRGILPEDYEPEEDMAQIIKETQAMMELGMAGMDLDPAQQDRPPGSEDEDEDEDDKSGGGNEE